MGLHSVIDSWREELRDALVNGKQDIAEILAKRVIERLDQDPDGEAAQAWALNAKGDALCILGRVADAQKLYEQAMHTHPNFQLTYETLATLLLHTQQSEKFIQVVARGSALFPESGILRFYAAKAALAQQDYASAETHLEAAIDIMPDHAEAHDSLGVIYQQKGRFREAALHHNVAVKQDSNHAGYLYNLAAAMDHLGDRNAAGKLYKHVLELTPNNARAATNLAVIWQRQGKFSEAEKLYLQALDIDPDLFSALMGLAALKKLMSAPKEALKLYKDALRVRPDDSSAKFMVLALSGETPDAPPPAYVADLFDDFAEDFETRLVGELEYKAPQLVWNAVQPYLEAFQRDHSDLETYTAIDLGAGTGLFGKYLKGKVSRTIGVDLSAKMLEKAQSKKIYDQIEIKDLTQVLQEQAPNSLCLAAAVDTFVYLGALDAPLKAAAHALHKDGILAFTVEAIVDEAELAKAESGYILRSTSRYAHTRQYIDAILQANGFAIKSCKMHLLRKNQDQPIQGYVCVATKL